MEPIKPCPFCGNNDPIFDETDLGNYMAIYLCCTECGCFGPHEATHELAAELWNKRT